MGKEKKSKNVGFRLPFFFFLTIWNKHFQASVVLIQLKQIRILFAILFLEEM